MDREWTVLGKQHEIEDNIYEMHQPAIPIEDTHVCQKLFIQKRLPLPQIVQLIQGASVQKVQ